MEQVRIIKHGGPDAEIRARLARAGFQVLSEKTVPPGAVQRWSADWVVIEARK